MKDLLTQEMLINMGPQHPSTHGVLRVIIKTDGELICDAEPVIGYLHRCAEKIGESVSYTQYIPYTDRLDYLSSMNNNLGFCLGVERLLGLEIPSRAQWIRVLMAELNRIASHLLMLGCFGLDLGTITPFLYTFRERELILNLFERASGARLTYNYIRIGGVARDVDKEFVQDTYKFLEVLENKIKDYNNLLSYNKIFIERTRAIGVIPQELAISYALTGPNLRACGINYDIRKIDPYSGYENFEFEVALGKDRIGVIGDTWNRFFVRVEEMRQSARIIKQALEGLPEGKYKIELKRKIAPPKGEIYIRTENPRGELGFYIISDGGEKPLRVKIRAPSFSNLSILPEISKGVLIADLVAILGSLDIVLGEIDR